MPADEEMTINERRKYLRKMKQRYDQVSRQEQGRLLDEMKAVTGLHRKNLIWLLNGDLERKPQHTGNRRTVPDMLASGEAVGEPTGALSTPESDVQSVGALRPVTSLDAPGAVFVVS